MNTELTKFFDAHGVEYSVDGDRVVVKGGLYLSNLSNLTSIPEGFNPTVGGGLYLNSLTSKRPKTKKLPKDFYLSLNNHIESKFNDLGYTIADDILAKIISTRGNLKKIIIVGQQKTSWLATDGKGNYAHGDTSREALAELQFKLSDRDVSEYENMPMDTVKTVHEWSMIYRTVTGACQAGTKLFIQSNAKKKKYTLAEILEATKDAFGGNVFKRVVTGE